MSESSRNDVRQYEAEINERILDSVAIGKFPVDPVEGADTASAGRTSL